MPIQDKIEKIKDYVEAAKLPEEHRMKLQILLSELRTETNKIERLNIIAEIRQDVYADVCNKMLEKIVNRVYD